MQNVPLQLRFINRGRFLITSKYPQVCSWYWYKGRLFKIQRKRECPPKINYAQLQWIFRLSQLCELSTGDPYFETFHLKSTLEIDITLKWDHIWIAGELESWSITVPSKSILFIEFHEYNPHLESFYLKHIAENEISKYHNPRYSIFIPSSSS